MSYRSHAAKPTAALWMFVAVADVALVLASAGVVVLIALASVGAAVVAGIGAWRYARRGGSPAKVPATTGARLSYRRKA